jgi:hypothetical protein
MRAKERLASESGSLAPAPSPEPSAANPLAPLASLAPTARRPYQPPRILFREPLEAMAAICSPHPPAKNNKGVCPMGPISS